MRGLAITALVLTLGMAGNGQTQSVGSAPEARVPEPLEIGACIFTTVSRISTRLTDSRGNPVPGSGSAVIFANGLYQGGHDTVRAIEQSRVGDRALVCMVARDPNCPGESIGVRVFTATNMRTLQSWTRADSSRGC